MFLVPPPLLVFGEPRVCLRGGGGERGECSVHVGDVSVRTARSVALITGPQLICAQSLIFASSCLHLLIFDTALRG